MSVIIIVVTVLAVAVPLVTLSVVLLVFVLVQVFSSWTAAGRAETSEATATLLLFREAELHEDPRVRRAVRGEIVCYSTSAIEQDWPPWPAGASAAFLPDGEIAYVKAAFGRPGRAGSSRPTGRSSRAMASARRRARSVFRRRVRPCPQR